MKVKLKFDMDKLKEFGKEHGEKFGLAAAVLILGIFIVKAASRDTLPDNLQAKEIEDRSQKADLKIKSLPAPPKAQDVVNVDFDGLVKTEPASVPSGVNIEPIVGRPFPDLVKRIDPTMFPVEELEATPFRGGLVVVATAEDRLNPPGSGGRPPVVGPAPAGLVPGRTPAARPGARPGIGLTGRPGVVAPGAGLLPAAAGGAAQGAIPFPADLPGPQSTGFAEGHNGIVITGLIPEQAQREEYDRRFKNARRATTAEGQSGGAGRGRERGMAEVDSPQYVWCFLERTDTTEGKTILLDFGDAEEIRHTLQQNDPELRDATRALVKKLAISPAVGNRLVAAERKWGAQPSEVVDKDYLSDKWFSWPLPPILLRDWGVEAAHPPKIPLAGPLAIANPDKGGPPGTTTQPGGFDDPATTSPNQGPGPMRRQDRGGIGPRPQAPGQNQQLIEVPYKLFRFVDLDVEPGHAYQYRVRMLLRNPNFGLEPQVLLKPETAKVAYNPTPWSEKSPEVAIPPDMRLLGGNIERPKHQEPKAKIGVFVFDKTQAIELIKEFETELGALVGTTVPDQVVKNVADPVKKEVRDITGEFRTASVLLDFSGDDEKLPGAGAVTDPGEMLLLDDIDHPETARLIVVNEAKDNRTIDDWKKTHIPEAPVVDAVAPGPAKAPANTPKAGGLIPGGGLLPGTPKSGTPRRPTGR